MTVISQPLYFWKLYGRRIETAGEISEKYSFIERIIFWIWIFRKYSDFAFWPGKYQEGDSLFTEVVAVINTENNETYFVTENDDMKLLKMFGKITILQWKLCYKIKWRTNGSNKELSERRRINNWWNSWKRGMEENRYFDAEQSDWRWLKKIIILCWRWFRCSCMEYVLIFNGIK